jgi:hypothetical protein
MDRLRGAGTLHGTIGDGDAPTMNIGAATVHLREIAKGSWNKVYAVNSELTARVSIETVPETEAETHKYWREIDLTAQMAARGLAPAVHKKLILSVGNALVRLGVVLERYEHSLYDVQLCPRLMREMFIESDGEAALVDLYARTSGVMRCIDTKPPNVVVRFAHERTRRKNEGAGAFARRIVRTQPRIALIDVDPLFCGSPHELDVVAQQFTGSASLADLDRALRDYETPSVLLAAAMSLLVHCVLAAKEAPFGFPYVRIARTLLRNWGTVELLVEDDERRSGKHRMVSGKNAWTVNAMLGHYLFGDGEADLDRVLRTANGLLENALRELSTRIFGLCAGMRLEGYTLVDDDGAAFDPVLYEYAELVQESVFLNLVSDRAELARRVGANPPKGRPECALQNCAWHYNKDSGARDPPPQFPSLANRPVFTERKVKTPVFVHVDHAQHEKIQELRVSRANDFAVLVHDVLLPKYGRATAVDVAHKVHASGLAAGTRSAQIEELGVSRRIARYLARRLAYGAPMRRSRTKRKRLLV